MNVDMSRIAVRIRPRGILDGSRAMEVLHELGRFRTGEIIVDFSGIRRFEAFGAEVLLKGLGKRRGVKIQCVGPPPCLAASLREHQIEVAEASGRPPRGRDRGYSGRPTG